MSVLKEVASKPNEFQSAVTTYAAVMLSSKCKQIWELAGGIGKSRIIAALGLILLSKSECHKVHFVIPIEGLMNRDAQEFKDYWEISGNSDKIEYHCDLEFKL